ncbi:MAG: extracellular solute-binding protein [Planctomycetota bacterium]
MKILFGVILVILLGASAGTYLLYPDTRSEVPVIYWVTDRNPARVEQIKRFHAWLEKNGHVDEQGRPMVELRLDMANRDQAKQIIQTVSGVASDVMDVNGGQAMRLFQRMAVIEDLTEDGLSMGFDPSLTYAALEPDITIDGRQYMFPCNVWVRVLWVNEGLFESLGLEPIPDRWTFEEFERRGKEFMARANPPGTRPGDRRFFANFLDAEIIHRGMGVSVFNETLTASDLDDPRYVRALGLNYKWIYEDNILPTPDDTSAFVAEQGYGGPALSLFGTGNFAMVSGGRYFLIRFRDFDNLGKLRVVEPPHGGFPNTVIGTRAAVVYAGSDRPDLAKLFLAYLASEDYNQLIIEDADALPPNPAFTSSEAFLRPPDHPNEWGVHGRFVEMAQDIAIPRAYSPFVLSSVVSNRVSEYRDLFLADQITAEDAARRTAEEINKAIADEVERKPELRPLYEERVALQAEIDAAFAEGRKVPAEWIINPFYRVYYSAQGMLIEDGGAGAAARAGAEASGGDGGR